MFGKNMAVFCIFLPPSPPAALICETPLCNLRLKRLKMREPRWHWRSSFTELKSWDCISDASCRNAERVQLKNVYFASVKKNLIRFGIFTQIMSTFLTLNNSIRHEVISSYRFLGPWDTSWSALHVAAAGRLLPAGISTCWQLVKAAFLSVFSARSLRRKQ